MGFGLSEELSQKRLTKYGLKVGNYEFYNIGNTNLSDLKKSNIIPNKDYKEYGKRKPDALLVDRRDKRKINVILVMEHKSAGKFIFPKEKKETIEQCNDICQVLNAEVGIATDISTCIWFNPHQDDLKNDYLDRTTNKKRSYTIIRDEGGLDFIKEFVIDQEQAEPEISKLTIKTQESIRNLDLIRKHISKNKSQITTEPTIDPTNLAKQIWQEVWFASGASPEKCLYTFLELFIFKYLSDLNILSLDDKGNKINFRDIYALEPNYAFKNYSENVRPYLKVIFPEGEDGTTIINGTVLNPDIPEHSDVFYKLLKRFEDFGELNYIDPKFKSKVFEEFMKEAISKKNLGQYFTPRSIIDAIIEISDIQLLHEGSEICDPACGVGGFILEPMKVSESGVSFYYQTHGAEIQPRYKFYGFDKGFEKEEQLTIILAKANMLIFLSELLRNDKTLLNAFSNLANSTFRLVSKSILGSLSLTEKDRYDLILTNPPYVTKGSSIYKQAIANISELSEFYKINAFGLEALFLEWIVRSVKPSRKAFVIIPEGILNNSNDKKLRTFIKEECVIDAIISLPINAFYRNPKKTYILALTKKHGGTPEKRKSQIQKEPVFTYLVSNTGETLDVNRFTIEDNDLTEMVSLYNQFKGAKNSFRYNSLRCKIQDINKFDPEQQWSVDRWWSKEEKVELKIEEMETVVTLEEFKVIARDVIDELEGTYKEIESL